MEGQRGTEGIGAVKQSSVRTLRVGAEGIVTVLQGAPWARAAPVYFVGTLAGFMILTIGACVSAATPSCASVSITPENYKFKYKGLLEKDGRKTWRGVIASEPVEFTLQ